MGVKNLWTVLAPFCDRKPLFELQGKTVAVDLSCWICEAQNIAEYQIQPRMYLRNLYFRTCYLLLMEVNPVFVLEGKAPELKYDTIASRNAIQFKGAKPKKDGVKTGKDRSRFHFVLRQCEQMLGYMGLACIKGNGEAESLCAYLNKDGLVHGCISQDSDCFAYGAQVVYRNFSISTQGTHTASGGAVDIYDIRKANQSLNFGRNKIVAMALLIGCDYSDGVHGVGKDSVLKFFETVSDGEVLDRLRSWREKEELFNSYEKKLNDKNICSSCGHFGKVQSHTKNGCVSCQTHTGCESQNYKEERLKMKNEVSMRSKAIQDPNFPDEVLIEEFLKRKDNVSHLNLRWKQPNAVQFVKFTAKFLQWEELYSFEKILPILTRWQCRNGDLLKNGRSLKGSVQPQRIKKIRNPKGVPSYEVIWTDPDDCFKGLIPDDQLVDVDIEKLWSTIEPQNLVQQTYPDLVEAFLQSKIKPKKPTKRKKKEKTDEENLNSLIIGEPAEKKKRKPRVTKKKLTEKENAELCNFESSFKSLSIEKPKIKPRNSYLKRAVLNSQEQNNVAKMSTPAKCSVSFDSDMSGFGDEDDLDVSDIVNEIVSRKVVKLDEVFEQVGVLDRDKKIPTEQGDFKTIGDTKNSNIVESCKKIIPSSSFYNLSFSDEEDNNMLCTSKEQKPNSSSFFMSHPTEENDIFEQTINDMCGKDSSGSETEEYEFDEEEVVQKVPVEVVADVNIEESKEVDEHEIKEDDDSFSVEYVPLHERLKRK